MNSHIFSTAPTHPRRSAAAQPFGFSTGKFLAFAQNRAPNLTIEAVRKRLARDGSVLGITPIRTATGHLLWPRAATLALVDLIEVRDDAGRRRPIDTSATADWLRGSSRPADDPAARLVVAAICSPAHDQRADPTLDRLRAVRAWVEAAVEATAAARACLTPQQRREAERLLGRAVASAVAALPADVLAQAITDVREGRA